MGWVCTNCGAKYGDPPYDLHSSWGCARCCPHLYSKEKTKSLAEDFKIFQSFRKLIEIFLIG